MITRKSIAILVFCCLSATAQGRKWTDSSGRAFEATLIRLDGSKVILNVSGRQRSFELSQLSAADQSFLKSGGTPSPTPRAPQRENPVARDLPKNGQIQADVSIQIKRLRAEPENNRWVYGSPNFEFICDEDLGLNSVRRFAWMFESVWQFCSTMPYDIPRLRAQQKVRMKTYLIKNYADYVKMGGVPRTAGVYIPSQDIVLIPFSSLDLGQGGGLKDANNTLRHEVTHQLMTGQSQQAGWFIEGSADYVATVPYDKTRMLTGRHLSAVASYVSAYGWNERRGHNLGKNITFGRLESFMQPNYAQFQMQKDAYAYALVLYTYFAKFDGQKNGARLAQYVAALQDGTPEADARKLLLAGRSYEQLEKAVASAWNVNGLRLKFE
ncbi:MAG: hypothetical protein ACSHYB_19530 [Roseibacillus sp.]